MNPIDTIIELDSGRLQLPLFLRSDSAFSREAVVEALKPLIGQYVSAGFGVISDLSPGVDGPYYVDDVGFVYPVPVTYLHSAVIIGDMHLIRLPQASSAEYAVVLARVQQRLGDLEPTLLHDAVAPAHMRAYLGYLHRAFPGYSAGGNIDLGAVTDALQLIAADIATIQKAVGQLYQSTPIATAVKFIKDDCGTMRTALTGVNGVHAQLNDAITKLQSIHSALIPGVEGQTTLYDRTDSAAANIRSYGIMCANRLSLSDGNSSLVAINNRLASVFKEQTPTDKDCVLVRDSNDRLAISTCEAP